MEDVLAVRDNYRMEQWAQIIQECQQSGLTNRAFCMQHHISEKSYYYWLRKLRNAAASSQPHLVQLDAYLLLLLNELRYYGKTRRNNLYFTGERTNQQFHNTKAESK